MSSEDIDEDSGDGVRSSQEIDEAVHTIFEEIFDSNIHAFRERVEFINENKFGDIWSDKSGRHSKTMRHAKTFVSAVAEAFHLQHDSVSKKIIGESACDAFKFYILKRLSDVVEKVGMLESSSKEMESEFFRKISEIKVKLEKKEVKETAFKSDVDEVISKSELMDPVHINHALICCKATYDCKDLENPEVFLNSKVLDKHWLREIVVSYQSPEVPRYVMARSGNVLYVAFRGLDNAAYTTIVGPVTANTSWRGQTNSKIFDETEKIPLGYFAREIIRNNRIIFTGHSTGGAIASLVVIYLLDKLRGMPASYNKRAIKCITFGMTPFGDKNLKQLVGSISGLKECFCHIVKHDDVIPKLFGSNLVDFQNELLDLVVNLVNIPVLAIGITGILPATVIASWSALVYAIPASAKASAIRRFIPLFDIFGQYYVLDPAKENKFTIYTGEDANAELKLHPRQITEHYKDYLVNPYDVSKRQEQLAKLSPSKVIELAYLSALLEGRVSCGNEKDGEQPCSTRYAKVKEFFDGVISVVPVESLFHAMAVSKPYTVLQCCQLLSEKEDIFMKNVSSMFLRDGMELALSNLQDIAAIAIFEREFEAIRSNIDILASNTWRRMSSQEKASFKKAIDSCTKPDPIMLAIRFIKRYLKDKRSPENSLCGLNLEEVYTASEDQVNSSTIEHPLTLVKNGRHELNTLSENMSSETLSAENANSKMLEKLNDLRENFRTCSALLGSFMEVHVHVPLESHYEDRGTEIATAAESVGLTVWMFLILPVSYVRTFIKRFLKRSRKLLVGVSSYMRSLYDSRRRSIASSKIGSYYDGKLEFLMTSMKKSSSSNKSFIAYSLERQLIIECEKRHIDHETPLDTILQQWDENFKDEALMMVDEDYRPMIARWIKWSLMINKLRESLAEQTAVGVIGLVNSGKSRFVRSMFGIETVSGTIAGKRTTVPFIYNLGNKIEGLDVIDFPGVDDSDKSIPELAQLLLSLARIVVFVLDYRRAHSDAAAQWVKILEEEKVPVLICLSFADKLFSEKMIDGQYPENSKVKKELKQELDKITSYIGQPENGKRDFEFVVFDLDNDSRLNTKEGKQKLAQAGLHDEMKVGRWIVEKLRDNKDDELADRMYTFITEKKSSTLNITDEPKQYTQKRSKSKSEGESVLKKDVSKSTKKRRKSFQSSEDQSMCSKDLPTQK